MALRAEASWRGVVGRRGWGRGGGLGGRKEVVLVFGAGYVRVCKQRVGASGGKAEIGWGRVLRGSGYGFRAKGRGTTCRHSGRFVKPQ